MHRLASASRAAKTSPIVRSTEQGFSTRQPPARTATGEASSCACGGNCPRCQLAARPRGALSDASEDVEPPRATAQETVPEAAPTPSDNTAAAPSDNAPEALDDPACTAGSTTITPVDKPITAHGSTVQDAVEDATNRQGGHVASVTPNFAPYAFCPIESSGKAVKSATVAVTETKVVPTWAERGQYPKEAQDMWDRYVAVVDGHENDHIAIDTKAFTDMDKKAVGKLPAQARAALDKVITAADTTNTALDNREGCIKLNGGTGRVTKEPRANC